MPEPAPAEVVEVVGLAAQAEPLPTRRSLRQSAQSTSRTRSRSASVASPRAARRSGSRPTRRTVLSTIGAVAAVGITAGGVGLSQALPGQGDQASAAVTSALSAQAFTAGSGAAPGPDVAVKDTGTSVSSASGVLAAARVPRVSRGKALRMTAVSRADQRVDASGCDGKVTSHSFANGQIPLSQLCVLPFAPKHRLRADAAVNLIRLETSYRAKFGEDMCLTDSYRSLASQQSLAGRKPGLAARPGTSEHGWGLAVDLCDGPDRPGSVRHGWLLANAPKLGWDNPPWARPGGSKPEPWHWEYLDGE